MDTKLYSIKILRRYFKNIIGSLLWHKNEHTHTGHAYRADIDGLRAIAVIAVVVYHAFPALAPGGFVGVDVFFVISGFLITGIIHKNLKNDRFSFSDFWARRVRRIFPSLLTVIISVFAAGWLYLLPTEFEVLKSHIKWGLGFVANFKLNSEVGYFDTAAELKPLLHLWSLAIEEQFYFIWPGLLWFCYRKKLNLFTVTFALALMSFGCRRLFPHTLSESFYLPWTRFWELQFGALIAIWAEDYSSSFKRCTQWVEKKVRPILLREGDAADDCSELIRSTASIVGAIMVAYACLKFNKDTPFPSKLTFIPVLGAALIVIAGRGAWFNRTFLSLRPMVFVGLISFPLYLWHWPLLSFVRIIHSKPNIITTIIVVATATLLAIISFYTVEKMLRFEIKSKEGIAFSFKAIGLLAANIMLIIVMACSSNFIEPRSIFLDKESYTKAAFKPKSDTYCKQNFPIELCQISHEGLVPTVALLGDSHANHLFPGLVEKLTEDNLLLVAKSGTPALYQVSSLRGQPSNLNVEIEKILNIDSIKTIILAGFWGNYIEASGIKVAEHMYKNTIRDDLNPNETDQSIIFNSGMIRTIEMIKKARKKVVVFYNIPSLPFSISTCAPRPGLANRFTQDCSFSLESAQKKETRSRIAIKEITEKCSDVVTVDIFDQVCMKDRCQVINDDGKWLYSDDLHLSVYGSSYALRKLNPKNWSL